MAHKDTTRTNTPFSDALPAGVSDDGPSYREAGLPCFPHPQTPQASMLRRGWVAVSGPFEAEDMWRGAWAEHQERSSLASCDALDRERTGLCGCPQGPWGLCEQPQQAANFVRTEAAAKLLSLDSAAEDVCESHSALVRKVKLAAENNIPVRRS